MNYQNPDIAAVAEQLLERVTTLKDKAEIMRSPELKALFDELKTLPPESKAAFGQEVNSLRQELQAIVSSAKDAAIDRTEIDVTAPFDTNSTPEDRPALLPATTGSQHPLMTELNTVLDIFYRMGFSAIESPEIDDDYHMFSALNFPEDHPARDDYDTFMTEQVDKSGKAYIAPAQTSTMQHRVLKAHKQDLEAGTPIAVVIPGRVFRNEDLDARHEHTFYQLEGVYVGEGVTVGNLIATLRVFISNYFQKDIKIATQPFYFPFTEPSLEFAASCPFCDGQGCHICSQTGWIELGGCGMIHPNVLREAGIDVERFNGFAWGFGIERMVMIRYGIEDIRHFEAGKLEFLRQFA